MRSLSALSHAFVYTAWYWLIDHVRRSCVLFLRPSGVSQPKPFGSGLPLPFPLPLGAAPPSAPLLKIDTGIYPASVHGILYNRYEP